MSEHDERVEALAKCRPPRYGDRVWVGEREHIWTSDHGLAPVTRADHRRSLANRIADAVFCSACLRLRISPGHLLVCPDRRQKVIHPADPEETR